MYHVLVLHHFVISSLSARLIRFFVSAHDTTVLWSNQFDDLCYRLKSDLGAITKNLIKHAHRKKKKEKKKEDA